jgi:hypothetical protein
VDGCMYTGYKVAYRPRFPAAPIARFLLVVSINSY